MKKADQRKAAEARLGELEAKCRLSFRESSEARHLREVLAGKATLHGPCEHGLFSLCVLCKTDARGGR